MTAVAGGVLQPTTLAADESTSKAERPTISRGPAARSGLVDQPIRPWHCLNFLPDPHGQGALRGTLP
jgi:hypothetical protein